MHINISDIPQEGLTLYSEEDPSTVELLDGVRAEDKIGVSLSLIRRERVVSVSGEIKASLYLVCSRCLREFNYQLRSPLRVDYNPLEQIEKEREYEIRKDELDIDFYKGETLDLTDLIKEQILLSLPMQPFCSTDCKGLCPSCGKALDEESCSCEIKEIDPRLAVLKKLKG